MLLDQLWRREDRARVVDRAHEGIDVALITVNVERRTRRSRDAEPPHERLRAVMPGANADALLVQHRGQVVRMNIGHREAHDTTALLRLRTKDMHAFDLRPPAGQEPPT